MPPAEEFAGLETDEMGCPIALSRGFQSVGAKLALDAFVAIVASMPIGDPRDPKTQLGPLVSEVQRARVEGYIASGKQQGARLRRV